MKVATAALTLALALGTGVASAQTIKIGLMLPFSGVNADLGDAQIKAFDLYMSSTSSSATRARPPAPTPRRWQPS